MAQEIELKFIVNHSAVEALRDHLNTLGGEHHDPVQLLNIYYETPDNWLRGHDMGLRIRGENGRYEMTEELIYLVIFAQAFPKSPILVENRRIGWCCFFGAFHPVNQGIFSDVHPFIKDLPELLLVSARFQGNPR